MSNLSISQAWDEAVHVLTHDGKLVTSVALGLIVLPQTVSGAVGPPPALSGVNPPDWMPIVALIVAVLGIAGQIAIARLALGPSTSVGEAIAHGFRRVVPALLAFFLCAVVLAVVLAPVVMLMAGADGLKSLATNQPTPKAGGAIIVAIIMCMLAIPRFQMLVPTAAGEEGGPIRLLQRSWQMSAGHYFKLLGFLVLILVAAGVVLLAGQIIVVILAKALFGTIHPFTLGALLAGLLMAIASAAFAAVSTVILARIYVQLSGRGAASVPKSGT